MGEEIAVGMGQVWTDKALRRQPEWDWRNEGDFVIICLTQNSKALLFIY